MAAVLALLSALVYGVGDFFGGVASRQLPLVAVALRTNLVGLLGLLVAAPLIGPVDLAGRDLALGALGGLVGGVGILLLYKGLAEGTMSIVAPITAVLSALVPVVAGLLGEERPAALAVAGIPIALVAIALLSRDPSDADDTGDPNGAVPASGLTRPVLLAALGAGLGFGLFFVCLDATGDEAGLWPVVAGRVASVAMFTGIVALVSSHRVGPGEVRRRGLTGTLVVCGLCDSGANALFLLATQEGLLTLVAVLGSLYPASTVAMATTFTHERLARHQIAGVVLALVSVVAITAA